MSQGLPLQKAQSITGHRWQLGSADEGQRQKRDLVLTV